jgi:hypothetical protein
VPRAPPLPAQERKLRDARERAQQDAARRSAVAAAESRQLLLRLRAARAADRRLTMLNQFKQSMAAPDWDLDDLEWSARCASPCCNVLRCAALLCLLSVCGAALRCRRPALAGCGSARLPEPSARGHGSRLLRSPRRRRPTFLPAMKLRRQRALRYGAADARRASLLGYVDSVADLAYPKRALRALRDAPRLAAYEAGLRAALQGRQGERAARAGVRGGSAGAAPVCGTGTPGLAAGAGPCAGVLRCRCCAAAAAPRKRRKKKQPKGQVPFLALAP